MLLVLDTCLAAAVKDGAQGRDEITGSSSEQHSPPKDAGGQQTAGQPAGLPAQRHPGAGSLEGKHGSCAAAAEKLPSSVPLEEVQRGYLLSGCKALLAFLLAYPELPDFPPNEISSTAKSNSTAALPSGKVAGTTPTCPPALGSLLAAAQRPGSFLWLLAVRLLGAALASADMDTDACSRNGRE